MNEKPDQAVDNTASDLDQAIEPFSLFAAWLKQAEANEPPEANAIAVATVGADGLPNVRMILLKGADRSGFVFYTNSQSVKGGELAATPKAALCTYWKNLGRQVRVRGLIELTPAEEADAYFATRSRESQIGAWASDQSRPLASRQALDEAMERRTAEFAGKDVPRPPHWLGYRLVPLEIEFWQHGAHRLHDRIEFRRASPQEPWVKTRLYP